MGKLGSIKLHIESETESHSIDATEYPLEKGEPITDHIKRKSSEFTLSGYILDSKWKTSKKTLETAMNSGKLLKYVGKAAFSNVIILNINEVHNSDVSNGLKIDIGLRRIKISKNAWEAAKEKEKAKQKKPTKGGKKKPTGKKGDPVYHTIKKGDTYSGLSKKYGSSITQLRAWNKYPDTKIPLNVKVRVA